MYVMMSPRKTNPVAASRIMNMRPIGSGDVISPSPSVKKVEPLM